MSFRNSRIFYGNLVALAKRIVFFVGSLLDFYHRVSGALDHVLVAQLPFGQMQQFVGKLLASNHHGATVSNILSIEPLEFQPILVCFGRQNRNLS